MNKHARQLKIREILQQNSVGNQHDLLQLLRDSGMTVAQATLSRDCAELGIIRSKMDGNYRLLFPDDNAGRIIKGLVGIEVLAARQGSRCWFLSGSTEKSAHSRNYRRG